MAKSFPCFNLTLKRRKRRAPHAPYLLAWASLLSAASLFLSGCSDSSQDDAKKSSAGTAAVPVVTARAETKDVPIELRNIGNVEAYATVNIRSQITGQITKIHFLEGQEVKKGDLLFTIDPRPANGALRQAEADLKRDQAQLVSAKLEFDRTKKLLESSIASRDDYDKAEAVFHALEATVMSDEASISRAQLQVEFTALRSPIDGRTGALMVREGNIVKAPDDLLVTINQVHPIYVTFSVPEQDLPAIRRRMGETKLTLEVQAASEPGLTNAAAPKSRGELSFVDNGVDPATGRIKMKATFPNEDNVLWPGQFVQSTLILDTLKQAVVVPTPAVQSSQSGDFVFAVKPGNTVEKRSIQTGFAWLGSTVVEKGVQSGETIVTDGQLRLTDGAHVTFTSEPVQSGTNAETAVAP